MTSLDKIEFTTMLLHLLTYLPRATSTPTTSSSALGPLIASSTSPPSLTLTSVSSTLTPCVLRRSRTLSWRRHALMKLVVAVAWALTWHGRGSWWDHDCAQMRGGSGRMKKMDQLGWWWKDEEDEWRRRREAMAWTLLAVMVAGTTVESGGSWRRMQSQLWWCKWVWQEGREKGLSEMWEWRFFEYV